MLHAPFLRAVTFFAVTLVACGGSVAEAPTGSGKSSAGGASAGGATGAAGPLGVGGGAAVGGAPALGGLGGAAAGASSQGGSGGVSSAGKGGSGLGGSGQAGSGQAGSGQAGAGQAGAGQAGSSASCGPSTCKGCCDATGACRPGDAPNACGLGGVTCEPCDALGLACKGDHCEGPPPKCGPLTCKGCCDAQGLCHFGTETNACGAGASLCDDCTAKNEGCVGSSCQGAPPPCGPSTCGGCCDAGGACLSGTTDGSCGTAGAACEICSAKGGFCQGPTSYCAYIPPCGSQTCPNGCCDASGACRVGSENAACGASGQACSDCAVTQESCAPQGFCYAGKHCGADVCAGCCTLTGDCVGGADAAACGDLGAVCDDCTSKGTICDAHVCATGSTCPTPYAGCNAKKLTAPPKYGTSCTSADLDALESACTGAGAGCGAAFGKLMQKNPSCFGCMLQFTGKDAYAKCLAPWLGGACNHSLSCALDCSASCDGCAGDKKGCQDALFGAGAECSTWVGGYYCAQAAIMGPAAFCDFANAGNDGGKWIHAVGSHYCQ